MIHFVFSKEYIFAHRYYSKLFRNSGAATTFNNTYYFYYITPDRYFNPKPKFFFSRKESFVEGDKQITNMFPKKTNFTRLPTL